jgi:hypothetical protein
LTEINLPEGLIEIGQRAFLYNNIPIIHLPDSIEYIGNEAFTYSAITNFVVENGCHYIGPQSNPYMILIDVKDDVVSAVLHENCKIVQSLNAPESLTNITLNNGLLYIYDGAFTNADQLTEIVIPDTVVSLGIAFTDCDNLQTLVIGKGVKEINNFMGPIIKNSNNITNITFVDPEGWYVNDFPNDIPLSKEQLSDTSTIIELLKTHTDTWFK